MVAYANPGSCNNSYRQQTAKTASPGELTLMLYDGCIKFLKLAKLHIEESNIDKAHDSSIKAQNIIHEFMTTLDMQYDVSKQLMSLYQFMLEEIKAANIAKETVRLLPVIDLLTELRNTWQQAVKINRQQQSGGAAPMSSGGSFEI